MATVVRLVAVDGGLEFPMGGHDGGSRILMRFYPAGDMDTIPWPLVSPFATEAQLRERLAIALYDERETNDTFPNDAVIELPDGTVFDFDALVP